MRFARKPGASAEVDGILPIAVTKARAVEAVLGEVWRAWIISTPFWTGTGFMKWVAITRDAASGFPVAAAIRVMEMEEVLVARMAWEGQVLASSAKMEDLREGISGTASITKSMLEREEMEVEGRRRERVSDASDSVRRCFETSFLRSLSVGVGVSSWS